MKANIALLLLLCGQLALCADPFGVDTSPAMKEEKVLDPALTQAEKDALSKYARASRDGNQVEAATKIHAVMEEIKKRMVGCPLQWSEEDLKARFKAVDEICLIDRGAMVLSNLDTATIEALQTFVGSRDDDPNNLVRRMTAISNEIDRQPNRHYRVGWRAAVKAFLDFPKYRDTTAKQKYEFVNNWLLPRTPKAASKEVSSLAEDLRADAGVSAPPKPKK